MRAVRYCFLFFALCLAVTPSYAQWMVFDASNLAEAVKEFKQLQQMYTTANQTRDQIIQAYNLAHYMSRMPQNLAQRYKSQFAMWTNLNAPNTYGNTSAWVNALNTGFSQQSLAGYSAAVVQVNPFPQSGFVQLDANTQATIQNQYATSDLAQGMTRRHVNWASGFGSCCATRLIMKSSVAAESCGRAGKPMQVCLITTVVLHRSDRVTE